ncbi:MAG: tyrosine-type recombinase/integrase [Bacteroidales bacterium]|nr:tyrosine-type recombinase/integrase [Bacteroidales bacterium]
MKERFLAYIQYEKRYSPHTVTAYRNDLEQFFTYLHHQYEVNGVQDITDQMIRSWLVKLMEEQISPRTINRKLTTLKSFYKFLIRDGVVSLNPMHKITSPKTSRRLPVFIDKEKMDDLLDRTAFDEGYPGVRDKLIIELFYSTGMRLSELVNLKESDIDFHQDTIKVLGKRNKERLIPFSKKMESLLKFYIEEKDRAFGSTDALFLTDKGRNVYPKMVYLLVKRYLSEVTTLDKKSPHVLRHTFATQMLNNGAELNAVKDLLGHANLSATQVYTHNTIEKLKRIYKQAHPKA